MKTALYIEIGERIQIARKACDLSQQELADVVGLTRTSISNIESGKQHLTIHTLFDIAAMLEISVHELLPEYISDEKQQQITELRNIANQILELQERSKQIRGK